MSDQDGLTPKTERKIPPSAGLALAVGLALAFPTLLVANTGEPIPFIGISPPGGAGLAAEPIPGIDVIVRRKPPKAGDPTIVAQTGADGTYQFSGLVPGEYDLSIAGQRLPTITVDDKGKGGISGVLSRRLEGTAFITFNGEVSEVPGLAMTGDSIPRVDVRPGATVTITVNAVNDAPGKQSTLIPDTRIAPTDITLTAGANAVNDPPGIQSGPIPDTRIAPAHGGTVTISTNAVNDAPSLRAAPGTGGGGDKRPGLALAGEPIPGVDVNLGKNPGGIIVASSRTDPQGNFHFDQLPAGNYDMIVNGERVQTITVDANRTIRGTLNQEPDGSASLSVNGIGLADHGTRLPASETSTDGNEARIIRIRITNVRANANQLTARPEAGDDKRPGLAGDPIPGVDVRLGPITKHNRPGLAGEPIPGVDIKLGKNPGGIIVASSTTNSEGNFHFDQLPAGDYTLQLPGLPSQALIVGADGIAGGKVMRGPGGSMRIFDRWGNATSPTGTIANTGLPTVETKKAPGKPVGFGSGNTIGAGPGMGGPMLPGAGPGLGPMGPGAGPGMGGPMGPAGGAMGRPGAGKP